MLNLIAPQSLKDLVDANAIRHATVVADNDVFKITVKYGTVERIVSVRTREGQIKARVFTSLDAVARFMREKVHLAQYPWCQTSCRLKKLTLRHGGNSGITIFRSIY